MEPQSLLEAASREGACVVEAPAGCGKTELIVRCSALACTARPALVLTHTNAGVRAIRDRALKLRRRRFMAVQTLDSLAVSLVNGLRGSSAWAGDFDEVRRMAAEILRLPAVVRGLRSAHSVVFVDEYQDCGVGQHLMVLALREAVPVVALGDPLQSIFGFDRSGVDWGSDVLGSFAFAGYLRTPWRWRDTNPALGHWTLGVREQLLSDGCIDPGHIAMLPSFVGRLEAIRALRRAGKQHSTVVGVRRHKAQVYFTVGQIQGGFRAHEGVGFEDAESVLALMESEVSLQRLRGVVECCCAALSRGPTFLASVRRRVDRGEVPPLPVRGKRASANEALRQVLAHRSPGTTEAALESVRMASGAYMVRPALWRKVVRVLRLSAAAGDGPFADALEVIKAQSRVMGERPEARMISRVHLIKGLQFDWVGVWDLTQLSVEEQYVAVSRARRELTLLG